jgi:hypothetical protein
MPATRTQFASVKAPCGKVSGGEHFIDEDPDHEHLQLTDELFYDCGCRSIRHEYHDGGVSRRLVHHNGHVLTDELITES